MEPETDDGQQGKLTGQTGDVGAVLRHDLKTPLATAMGHLELAWETGEFDHLEKTKAALERMEAIIDDLSGVIEEGQVVNEVVDVDVGETARQVWDTFEDGNSELRTESVVIHADESALYRLFENLIKNALEHGGDEITVRIGEIDEGFYVEDDGLGIPADERRAVLQPGYSSIEDGTGLGLVSVHQIALAHGWTMDVVEGSDGGARVEFRDVAMIR